MTHPGGDPQALAQVDNYIRHLPHPECVREAVSDTAGAAQSIAEHGWKCALARDTEVFRSHTLEGFEGHLSLRRFTNTYVMALLWCA